MPRPSLLLRRLDRAMAVTVLGAVLLVLVATGEARAAVVLPPEGDRDADPVDDLLRRVGAGDNCQGFYGGGKVAFDLGDSTLSTADADELETALDDTATIDGPAGFSAGVDDVVILGGGLYRVEVAFIEDAFDCGGLVPANVVDEVSPPFGPFDVEFAFPLDGGGTRVCTASLPSTVMAASLRLDGDSTEYVWTSADGVPADDSDSGVSGPAIAARSAAVAAAPVDCTGSVTPASTPAYVSALVLTCEPDVASPGQLVTCTVTGGDPGVEILWRASASPAFASAGVLLDAEGRGTFSFRVPASIGTRPITVELVDWARTAPVAVVKPPVPVLVPAGGGRPGDRLPAPVAASILMLLGTAGLWWRRSTAAR